MAGAAGPLGNTKELPIYDGDTSVLSSEGAPGLLQLFGSSTGVKVASTVDPFPISIRGPGTSPADVKDATADANFASADFGVETNSRLAVFGAADFQRLTGRPLNGTAIDETLFGLNVNSVLRARDSSAAVNSQIINIEGRAAVTDADLAQALSGITVNARPGIVDEVTADYVRQNGLKDGIAGSYVFTPRESGWPASRMGRRFFVTHQTIGTVVTGQTAFSATTPTFLLSNTSTKRLIIRSIQLAQAGTVAGGLITVAVQINTTDDFSAGGTAVTPQNTNEASATTPAAGVTFRFNPTATGAAGRVLVQRSVGAVLGTVTVIDLGDAVILGATSSSMSVFTFAAVTAPSWYFIVEYEEV